MVYLNIEGEKRVVGFSMRDAEYFGYDKKQIFSLIYGNPAITVLKNGECLSFSTKNSLRNNQYLIPYICAE